ncbi:hypothetical protein BH09CHL1_BH09CHL1_24770 [soil metagenome]
MFAYSILPVGILGEYMANPTPMRSKEIGRPRSFTDDTVFNAVNTVLQEQGFSGLTLAAIAKTVGCTGQALNARFDSRLGLLAAYIDWAIERDVVRFQQLRLENLSPLAALRARFLLPIEGREEEISGNGSNMRILSLILESRQFPEFAERTRLRIESFQQHLAELIEGAVRSGELVTDDPAGLAHLIMVATTGASMLVTPDGEIGIVDAVTYAIELTLAPYLPK